MGLPMVYEVLQFRCEMQERVRGRRVLPEHKFGPCSDLSFSGPGDLRVSETLGHLAAVLARSKRGERFSEELHQVAERHPVEPDAITMDALGNVMTGGTLEIFEIVAMCEAVEFEHCFCSFEAEASMERACDARVVTVSGIA